MERHDVQRELQKQILRDCEGVKNLNFQSGEDVALLTRRGDLLTVQVKSRQKLHFPSISYYFHIPKNFLIFFLTLEQFFLTVR